MELQYLGTAAAEGWPALFCDCRICRHARETGGKELRTRTQSLVDGKILIDFPPDTYAHALGYSLQLGKIKHLLVTHSHMDHFFPVELIHRHEHFKTDEKAEFYKKRQGQDTMKTADDIILLGEMLVRRYRLDPETDSPIPVKVDDGGVGGGVVDRLKQIKRNDPERFWWLEVYPVIFGQRIKHKYYHDSTTYMMAVVKKLLQPYDEDTGERKPVELILPDDDDLVAQLSGRKYALTEASKIKVESKEAMKKRGLPSPDEADCVLLLCLPVKPPKKRGGKKNG